MPRGPLGGPRPLSEAELEYSVSFIGDTSLEQEEDIFNELLTNISRVILAVNRLAHPSQAPLKSVEIIGQAEEAFLRPNQTKWEASYAIRGREGLIGLKASTSISIWRLHEVMIRRNNEPIENSQAIQEFDPSPFIISTVQVRAV